MDGYIYINSVGKNHDFYRLRLGERIVIPAGQKHAFVRINGEDIGFVLFNGDAPENFLRFHIDLSVIAIQGSPNSHQRVYYSPPCKDDIKPRKLLNTSFPSR